MKIEDLDPPEYHLTKLNGQIREMMNAVLRPHGLKLVEWRMMQCLADQGDLSVCDLASLAVIERTATSRMIDRLVDRGFVSKTQMEDDRRYARVSLRAAGRDKLNACNTDVDTARAQLFDGFSRAQISDLLTALKRLQRNSAGIALDLGRAPRRNVMTGR